MQSISSASTAVLREALAAQPDTLEKVAFAWRVAAGPAMGRAATIDWSPAGVLRVRASTDAWRREITRARPMLTERLSELLGQKTVRSLVIDSPEPAVRRGRRRT